MIVTYTGIPKGYAEWEQNDNTHQLDFGLSNFIENKSEPPQTKKRGNKTEFVEKSIDYYYDVRLERQKKRR